MNNRLLQFLAAENINQSQFADSIGVARASISHIIAGRNKPGYDFIENTMKRYPALNIEWLLTGRGKMYKAAENDDSPSLFPVENRVTEHVPEAATSVSADSGDSPVRTAMLQSGSRRIIRILVLYDDNTFREFTEQQP